MYNLEENVYIKYSNAEHYYPGVIKKKFSPSPTINGEVFYLVETLVNGSLGTEVISSKLLHKKRPLQKINLLKNQPNTHERWDGVTVHSSTGIPIDDYVDFTGRKIL